MIFGLSVAVIAYRLSFLTTRGAGTAAVMGAVLFGLGGVQWTLPMFVFFIPSSILSAVAKHRNPLVADSFAKSGCRDAAQVLSNGGIGGALCILSFFQFNPTLYDAYICSLAVVAADTWGTEIGVLSGRSPILITTLRHVETGRSGAVSLPGCAGALGGALLVSLSGISWYADPYLKTVAVFTFIGLIGSLFDSLLGATIQAHFVCSRCGMVTEKIVHCGSGSGRIIGWRWMTNDAVNLIAAATGAFAALLL